MKKQYTSDWCAFCFHFCLQIPFPFPFSISFPFPFFPLLFHTKIVSCRLHWYVVFRYANEGFPQIERSYCVAQAIIYVAVHVPANFVSTRMHHHIYHTVFGSAQKINGSIPRLTVKKFTEQYITRLYQLIKKIIFLVLQSST